ncbi:hypothetical protein ACIRQP_21315 [Streptomyces sp. NPDC102274]|uniref:hypothetical protein n=1 Tax=Streptomyces sp. NPDC102274 TaxID=3366151 RepID=UPI003824A3DE
MTSGVEPVTAGTVSGSRPPAPSTREVRDRMIHVWREWSTRHRLLAAMLGGLVAVHISSLVGFWMGGFGLTRLDYNTANGTVLLPGGTPTQQFVIGGLSHYADGVFFAVLFALALSPVMPLPATRLGNIGKSLILGTVLALLAIFVTAPFVFGPASGVHDSLAGVHAGWNSMLSVFIFHWLYGLHIGLIYNPYDQSPSPV